MKVFVAKEFSKFPAGRQLKDGNRTGERFRRDFLEKNLQETDEVIEVVLDDVMGFPSSFLEEAFGGLVRIGYSVEELKERLRVETSEPHKKRYISQIWEYIQGAAKQLV